MPSVLQAASSHSSGAPGQLFAADSVPKGQIGASSGRTTSAIERVILFGAAGRRSGALCCIALSRSVPLRSTQPCAAYASLAPPRWLGLAPQRLARRRQLIGGASPLARRHSRRPLRTPWCRAPRRRPRLQEERSAPARPSTSARRSGGKGRRPRSTPRTTSPLHHKRRRALARRARGSGGEVGRGDGVLLKYRVTRLGKRATDNLSGEASPVFSLGYGEDDDTERDVLQAVVGAKQLIPALDSARRHDRVRGAPAHPPREPRRAGVPGAVVAGAALLARARPPRSPPRSSSAA